MFEMERPTQNVVTSDPAVETAGEPPRHDAFEPPWAPRETPPVTRPRGFGGGRRVNRADGDDGGTFDVRNSWQVVVGSILIPLGLVLILIGWYGAAHARVVQQQIPYMVSGAFIGLGCMVVGGLFYWGHWLYRLYDQANLQHEEQLKVLEGLVRTLAGEARLAGAVKQGDAGSDSGAYFATAYGSVYHLSGCPVIAHHPDDLRVLGTTGLAGLRPCQICSPH